MEMTILQWINENMRNGILDQVMIFVSRIGDAGFIWTVFAVLLLLVPKYRKIGIAVFAGLFLSSLLCDDILKPLIARPRPEFSEYLIRLPKSFSFPSGHTMSSFTAAAIIAGGGRPAKYIVYLLAFLIGFSRLYLCVHYPSDVLCGAVFGILLGKCLLSCVKDTQLASVRRRT